MSLLSKLEKLERIATVRGKSASLAPDPELIAALGRIIEEVIARPEPTIHERIAELREGIKLNATLDEPWKTFMDSRERAELARLEAELAKLQ